MNPGKPQTLIHGAYQWRHHLVMAFPLLTRELIEQSARKRTFILRTTYAAILYGFVLWSFWSELGGWSNQSFRFLGRGRELFQALVKLQFAGLYLFLPAMTSGVLTIEKERDTLSLLLLTRLGPWSILIGKLFSRLVPMASFLLLSLPLVAVAYSLGGIELNAILEASWALFATSLQVGAMSLACSAYFRSTASAFMATYLIGAALVCGPLILTEGRTHDPLGIVTFAGEIAGVYGIYPRDQSSEIVHVLIGPWICNHPYYLQSSFSLAVSRSIPILLFAGVCLLFARAVLWRRAFVQPSNLLLTWFRSLDKVFHRLNQNRVTKGIVLTREDVALPTYDPIRWRETKKRSLGTTRYLVRLLLLIEVPVVFGMTLNFDLDIRNPFNAPCYVTAWALWIIATLVIVIQSTGLIGLEKSRQTLDVLLTVPMASETIVREKFAGVWRMIRMLWIPFGTVYVLQFFCSALIYNLVGNDIVFGAFRGLLATLIYPPLIASLGFHFGMRCRSQTQAVLVTLSTIAIVCAIPPLLVGLFGTGDPIHDLLLVAFNWLSPVTVLTTNNAVTMHWRNGRVDYEWWSVWLGLVVHFLIYGTCLIGLWSRVLKTFALNVHRNDGQIVDDDDIERLSLLRQKIVGGGIFRASADER